MRALRRNGVALFYEEKGAGEPSVLLVHGWCCDHTYFAPQFEHFAGRGHRVVAVDLRGHGRSDKPQQEYTMQLFADDLSWICERLGLENVVVVGHSMGGIVAFDLAARYAGLLSAIVMLDGAVVLPSSARTAIPSLLEKLRGHDYRQALRDYATNSLFIATDDQERKKRILESMSSTPQYVVVSAFEGLRDFNWVRQVDPDTALRQQERLTELVDSRHLVVKTAALDEAIDEWPAAALRGAQSAHSVTILASEAGLSLSRATPMPPA